MEMTRTLLLLFSFACSREAPPVPAAPREEPDADLSLCVVHDETPKVLLTDLGACEAKLGRLAVAARDAALHERWERALPLLVAARSTPGFRVECDVPDALASQPMIQHPNVDDCTKRSAFAPDPWMMDLRFYCAVDIGTFLFLDRVARLLPPGALEDPKSSTPDDWEDASWLRGGFFDEGRSIRCDPAHPNYVVRQTRIREAADRWNTLKGRARKEHREDWLAP